MTGSIVFDPLLPWWLIACLGGMAIVGIALALIRGLSGWPLRGLAALVVIAALAGPVYQQEERDPLTDIVLLLEDQSASQRLADRATTTTEAADALAAAHRVTGDAEEAVRRHEDVITRRARVLGGTHPCTIASRAALALARTVASKLGVAVRIGKEAFYRQIDMTLDEAYAYTGSVMVENLAWRDTEEGIAAFLEKRPPEWEQS